MRIGAIICAIAAVIGVSACGGEGPQARFHREADRACERHQPRVQIRKRAPTIRTARRDTATLRTRLNRRIRALEQLEKPRGDGEQIERWLVQLRANAASLRRIETALRRGRLEAARRPQTEYATGDLRARELARAYGLTRCASG